MYESIRNEPCRGCLNYCSPDTSVNIYQPPSQENVCHFVGISADTAVAAVYVSFYI